MSVIRFADVELDAKAYELRRGGVLVDVQPQVLDVLIHLIERRARVVPKEELLDEVWEHRFVTESALTSRIKSARQAIGDNGRDQLMIRTVHGRGYRFVAEIAEDTPAVTSVGSSGGDAGSITSEDGAPASNPRVQLPHYVTPFVGREFELSVVEQLLDDPISRLVTILGPGGMGKTRLAAAAAERSAAKFGDGVYFVPLAPVVDRDGVVGAVAESMAFALDARHDAVAQLRSFLAGKSVLLVFDNVEHVQPIDLMADLLEAAPGVQILATSRERLGMRAEWVFELGGMGWSSADDGSESAGGGAVDLFVRAARSAKADLRFDDASLEAVRRICRLVGGMPLAVELAAGWSDVLSVGGIEAEIERGLEILETDLRDVPERHRSIRSVCDSSWARLTQEERDVFMKLSVFRGGFTRLDAEAVAGSSLPTLRRLVATSMVAITGDHRYAIHDLLRQFGEEALSESGLAPEIRVLHSDHYLGRLAERTAALKGDDQLVAVSEIAADLDNIRVAWRNAAVGGRTHALEGALEPLWLFFDTRGNSGALAPMIDEVLRAVDPTTDGGGADPLTGASLRPMLRAARGLVRAERGALDEGRLLLEGALELLGADAGHADDPSGIAHHALVHLWLGWVDFLLARNADALVHGERGLALFEVVDDRWGVARCQYLLGNNETALGRLTSAERTLMVCRATAESIGDLRGAALARRNLSILAGWFGRYGEARALLGEVLAAGDASGDRLGSAYALRELGKIETAEGRMTEAVATLERSIAITDELENRWESAVTHDDLGNAFAELGDLDAAQQSLQRCLEAATTTMNRYYIARCTGDLGSLAARRGEEAEATRLLGEARTMWEAMGHEPYLCWTVTQLAHLASADPGAEHDALHLYAGALNLAMSNGLAPFALEIVVGAARLDGLGPPALLPTGLRYVVEHPATTSTVRERARSRLAELDGSFAESSVASELPMPGGWQELARAVAIELERRLHSDN